MSITNRQFDLLQAMGIDIWQRRSLSLPANKQSIALEGKAVDAPLGRDPKLVTNNTSAYDSSTKTSSIDLKALRNQQLFNDVILCLGVNINDLSVENNHINLGLINWQFHQHHQIEFTHSCLKSPELSVIASSVQLKKLLWQSIQTLST